MASEDFDQRIRETFDNHTPPVEGDWRKMRAALAAASGGASVGVVRAKWTGIAAGVVAGVGIIASYAGRNDQNEVPQPTRPLTENVAAPSTEVSAQEAVKGREPSTEVVRPVKKVQPARAAQAPPDTKEVPSTPAMSENKPNSAVDAPVDALILRSDVREACVGTEVAFNLEGDWTTGSILWNFGDGGFSNEKAPKHVFEKPGKYDITITVRSPSNGAMRTTTVEDMISIRSRPQADLHWSMTPKGAQGEVEVRLIDASIDATSSAFLRGKEDVKSGILRLNSPGKTSLTAVAKNEFGCSDERTEMLTVGTREDLDMPLTFSAVGDGKTGGLLPRGLSKTPFVFTVYGGDGKVVFTTTDARKGWTGRLANNQPAERGSSFTWTCVREIQPGRPSFFSGRVTIE
jgi:PKD repeat protein